MNTISRVAGLMSGTSLDGLDMVLCEFIQQKDHWNYKVLDAKTLDYTDEWVNLLKNAEGLSGLELIKLHRLYGQFLGKSITQFLGLSKCDLISSHGHTVFHKPDVGLTFQLGCGLSLAATANLPVVYDFRTLDVALGGQGAPLVPIGDALLYGNYEACLNLGGFSNISFNLLGKRTAFDICPVNIALNHFCEKEGRSFDEGGALGRQGNVNTELLRNLNNLPFYEAPYPKSLGKEWLLEQFLPVIEPFQLPVNDTLRILYQHVAVQISNVLNKFGLKDVLVTGGGTHNIFMMELIQKSTQTKIIVPDKETIDFKEAIVFAFLGLLRSLGQINVLSSVTGASHDCMGGVLVNI